MGFNYLPGVYNQHFHNQHFHDQFSVILIKKPTHKLFIFGMLNRAATQNPNSKAKEVLCAAMNYIASLGSMYDPSADNGHSLRTLADRLLRFRRELEYSGYPPAQGTQKERAMGREKSESTRKHHPGSPPRSTTRTKCRRAYTIQKPK